MPLAKVNSGSVHGQIIAEGTMHPALIIDTPAYVEDVPTYEARLRLVDSLQRQLRDLVGRRYATWKQEIVDSEYLANLRREVHRLQGLHKKNGELHQHIKNLQERTGLGRLIALPPGLTMRYDGTKFVVEVENLIALGAHQVRLAKENARIVAPEVRAKAQAEAESFFRRWEGTAGVTPRYQWEMPNWDPMGPIRRVGPGPGPVPGASVA